MTIKLYDFDRSGNCYKVRLIASLLELGYERIPVNLFKGEHKTPEFLQLNPLGQVPVLADGDLILADSQAILTYLARCYGDDRWLPQEPELLSQVVRWLSISAGEMPQGLGAARRYYLIKDKTVNIDAATQKAEAVLAIVNQHLANRDWLVSDQATIADIAAFPYIALAPEAQIALDAYPNILSWIDRIKHLPGFVGMPGIPILATT